MELSACEEDSQYKKKSKECTEENVTIKTKITDLQNKLKTSEKENSWLAKDGASLRQGNETSEKELKTLKESNSQSKKETETLKSKIEDLQNKLKTSEKENSWLAKDVASLKVENERAGKFEKQIEDLTERGKKLQEDKQHLVSFMFITLHFYFMMHVV